MVELADDAVVDGRYRIVGRIGSGGMADVYRAEDTHLGRQVALKMLHRRFARDAEFVERFRREASSAAGLQHPNVVNVFDRGEHDGTYYIAMEHLGGRSLKDLIASEAPVAPERAIDLGIQILQAAGFAHRRGVIHRDFKPHNVIVDAQDRVKVTDFGIARAGASEMTETGSIMGTAQYLSPEQAQGHGVSEASDLYSIGVILYEMLCGRLPFQGDSAVAIALKHLTEEPWPVASIQPGVHPALEAAVMRALAKDPEDRYASADDFIAALEAARAEMAAGRPAGEHTAVFAPLPVEAPSDLPPLVDAGLDPDWEIADDPPADWEPRRRWPWVLLGLLVLALAVAVGFALASPDEVEVPRVTGQPVARATASLDAAGFVVRVVPAQDRAEAGTVILQRPADGSLAYEGSRVTITVSQGPGERSVPPVAGLPEARAFKRLNDAGFEVDNETQASAEVEAGLAIRTSPPAGRPAEVGSRVRLFVSSGPAQVTVPNVVGLTRSSARSALEAEGLIAVPKEKEADEPEDEVIAQDPDGGAAVDEGSRVTITVSTGPGRVEVPDVLDLAIADARAELREAGFAVEVRDRAVESEEDEGIVLSQRPPAGTELRRGGTVVITVGRFREPATGGQPPENPG